MNPVWLLRMARWVRNPPGPRKVKLILGVVAAGLVLAGIEAVWGWPAWLTPQRVRP